MSMLRGAAKGAKGAAKGARAAHQARSIFRLDPWTIVGIALSMIGMPLMVLALIILVLIVMIFGSGTSMPSPDPSSSAGPGGFMGDLFGGDLEGELNEDALPDKTLAEPIKKAAKECDVLTPAVLAAQIEYESNFNKDKVGPNGEKGISQVPLTAFQEYGEDDDDNGEISATDNEDSIYAQARYLCALARDVQRALDDKKVIGDKLTLTLLAWDQGLDAVTEAGGVPGIPVDSYPYKVRSLAAKYLTGDPEPADETEESSALLSEKQFGEMFPDRNSFYTYAGLTTAMKTFPEFAATGDDDTHKRELAAFLANLSHESRGLQATVEDPATAGNDYCDETKSYGCPAGDLAYFGRGPIQLSWNYNYQAAGTAMGVDLLNNPGKVAEDASVAWQTAIWFWMTSTGSGTATAHAAITGTSGFGATIRAINGALECDGKQPDLVQSRVSKFRTFAQTLGVAPGDNLTC